MSTIDAPRATALDLTPAHGASWWRDTLVFAQRNLLHIRQIPEKLLDVTVQPLMFTLLFTYVFGGAINVKGSNYREFLIAGILIQTLAFGMTGPATAIATDLMEGVIDRFRSLPSSRTAYLCGHIVAEIGGMVLATVILLGTGLIVGWRTHTNVTHVLAGFVLLFAFAMVMVVVGTYIGLLVRSPDAVMGIAFTAIFPLTFVSNAFVPIDTLPTLLRTFAAWNPFTVFVAGIRELFGNQGAAAAIHSWPLDHAVFASFLYCAVLLAMFIPLSLRRYTKRTTG